MKKEETKTTKETKHKSLAHAMIAVMKEVKGMEKNSRVGGNSKAAYDGTKDQDVKEKYNDVFAENGLCILPIDIEETTQIDRWEEEDQWSKSTPKAMKQKQSVFTKVTTKYKLIHADSGESEILTGYGHGVDPQDKGAGKATTYALKNCLLYSALTPVGKIDDTDETHSKDIATIQGKAQTKAPEKPKKVTSEDINRAIATMNLAKDKKEINTAWNGFSELLKKEAKVVEATKKAGERIAKPEEKK